MHAAADPGKSITDLTVLDEAASVMQQSATQRTPEGLLGAVAILRPDGISLLQAR